MWNVRKLLFYVFLVIWCVCFCTGHCCCRTCLHLIAKNTCSINCYFYSINDKYKLCLVFMYLNGIKRTPFKHTASKIVLIFRSRCILFNAIITLYNQHIWSLVRTLPLYSPIIVYYRLLIVIPINCDRIVFVK